MTRTPKKFTVDYWYERAANAWKIASTLGDAHQQVMMQRIAADFEKLAKSAASSPSGMSTRADGLTTRK